MRKIKINYQIYKLAELSEANQKIAIANIIEETGFDKEHVTPQWIEKEGYEFFSDGKIYDGYEGY